MTYTVKEAAKIFKLHPETIKRMIKRGEIKAVKIANSWRISQEEINRLITGEQESSDSNQ